MKKIKIVLFFMLIFIGIENVFAFDNTLKVYDYAQILTSSEEEELKNKIDTYINTYSMDMVIVTVRYHEKSTTQDYAQDFYDYNNFGIGYNKDGIICVIDFTFGYTDLWISTTGKAINIYSDARIDSILDNIAAKKNNGYYEMFNSFIETSSDYASKGVAYTNNNYNSSNTSTIDIIKSILPSLLIPSLIVPTVVILILIFKNKMVRKSVNANYYLVDGSVVVTTRDDRFVTTHTTSVRINDSSSSSGGRSGGSSISRGSSGRSHGGGGRRL